MTDPIPLGPEDRAILALESPTIAGHTCKVVRLGGAPLDVDALRARIAERIALAPALTRRLGGDARRAELGSRRGLRRCPPRRPGSRRGAGRSRRAARARRAAVRAAPGPRATAVADRRGRARRRRQRARVADPPRPRRRHRLGALCPRAALGPPARRGRQPPRRRPRSRTPPTRRAGVRISPASCAASTRAGARHSPFDGPIGGRREVAFAAVSLPALHDAAKGLCGATVNDGVLTIVTGALARWLRTRHGHLGTIRREGSGEPPPRGRRRRPTTTRSSRSRCR